MNGWTSDSRHGYKGPTMGLAYLVDRKSVKVVDPRGILINNKITELLRFAKHRFT